MTKETSITNIDDNKIIHFVHQATRRIVYMAPGISDGIAHALALAWKKLGIEAVTVILDVDPEVYRLGYGTIEGLRRIKEEAMKVNTLVCKQPGVRIGLLIADDVTFIYTPTPLLIEAGSNSPKKPNAIQLQSPPQEIARDVGIGPNPITDRVVGLDPVKGHEIEKVEVDLETNPPVKFDLARKVRVYSNHFQFVEFEMTGCLISRKKVSIPSFLMGFANKKEVQSQFHAHYNLISQADLKVQDGHRELSETYLLERKKEIINDFLVTIKGYGNIIRMTEKDVFEMHVDCLKSDIKAYQKGIKIALQKSMDTNAAVLVEALLPSVVQNPPAKYTKVYGSKITKEQIGKLLDDDIANAFGTAEALVGDMRVKVIFKNITHESLNDVEFISLIRDAMPDIEKIHDEYDVAKAIE